MSRPRFVCLVGPTGAGKSALAIRLAQECGGAVVNADSRQVYKAFPIITAQPSHEEQAACPHRLYTFLDTRRKLSAGTWADMALAEINRLSGEGLLPLLVGGTGLYLRALADGITAIPPVDEGISQRLQGECAKNGPEALHARLLEKDPAYAARIHPRDSQRVVRALEVFESTGKTFSWWHSQTPPPLNADILWLGVKISLADLTPFLAGRIDRMLEAGALAEARAELERCPEDAPGWSGIGCRELRAWLLGDCGAAAARELWIKNTRAYAKRQLTWFNADPRIRWFAPHALDGVPALVQNWLAGKDDAK